MLDSLVIDPIDPNAVPPSRPPSALSMASATSYFALYVEPEAEQVNLANPPPEYIPRRVIVETMSRHGRKCLLCGTQDELVVVRGVQQHADPEIAVSSEDPISWLQSLNLLPSTYVRDDWTNLMTLCRPHAQAYDQNVWRWIPCAKFRKQMVNAISTCSTVDTGVGRDEGGRGSDADGDVTMSDITVAELSEELPEATSSEQLHPTNLSEGRNLAETLVDDGISGNTKNPEINFRPMELPTFDVLILQPNALPPFSLAGGTQSQSPASRLLPDWRKLTLNPYVAYASAMPLLRGVDATLPDNRLGELVNECLTICSRLDRM